MWDPLNEFINRTDENDTFAQQVRNEIRTSGQSNELKTFRRGALRELRRTLMEQAQEETILRAETYPGGDKTFALPGLIEGIQSSNPDRRLSAFTHLIDNFRSENFVRSAVAGTDLLEKCLFCFMRSRRNMITSKYQDESMLLHLLETLSTYKKCAEEMSKNKRFVTEMYKIIFNIQNDQQHRAAKILSNITKHSEQEALVFLKRHNAFNEISKIFNRQTCTMYMPTELWRHLGHLLEVAPEKAIKKGFFDIFYYRIKYKLPNFHFENMKCFALLLRSKLGRDVFDHCEDGMSVFYALVHKPTELSDYENTLEALNEALLSPYSIDKASEFEHFPKAIMQVAKRYENKKVRLNCFAILRKMYQSFRLRHEILQYCMPALKNLKCDSTDVEYNRYELISWINRNQLSSKWY